MENDGLYKVLIGDIFGGFGIVETNMTKEAADKLAQALEEECDYFTSTMVKPVEDKTWG